MGAENGSKIRFLGKDIILGDPPSKQDLEIRDMIFQYTKEARESKSKEELKKIKQKYKEKLTLTKSSAQVPSLNQEAEISNLSATSTQTKPQSQQLKPVMQSYGSATDSFIEEQQEIVDRLLQKDRQNFHAAFGKDTRYTGDINQLCELVEQNCAKQTQVTHKFISEHNELLLAQLTLITQQKRQFEVQVKRLQTEVKEKNQRLVDIGEKLKETPELSSLEKAHTTDKPTFWQKIIVGVTKLFYPKNYIATVIERNKSRTELLQQQKNISSEISPLNQQVTETEKNIASKHREYTDFYSICIPFITRANEAYDRVLRATTKHPPKVNPEYTSQQKRLVCN